MAGSMRGQILDRDGGAVVDEREDKGNATRVAHLLRDEAV